MSEGVAPIIAHPERNSAFRQSPSLLFELIRMGALAQANAGSFLGQNGSSAEAAAFNFLKFRLYHFIASDGHNDRSKAPRLRAAKEKAAAILGEKEAEALVEGNPAAVIEDGEIPYLPEPLDPDEKGNRFKIKLPFRKKNG
jgi:protein-tyrosine phosphatase